MPEDFVKIIENLEILIEKIENNFDNKKEKAKLVMDLKKETDNLWGVLDSKIRNETINLECAINSLNSESLEKKQLIAIKKSFGFLENLREKSKIAIILTLRDSRLWPIPREETTCR